jgi:hypothetical protein
MSATKVSERANLACAASESVGAEDDDRINTGSAAVPVQEVAGCIRQSARGRPVEEERILPLESRRSSGIKMTWRVPGLRRTARMVIVSGKDSEPDLISHAGVQAVNHAQL